MNVFIVNTNKNASERYEKEMVEEQKCSAYRSTKMEITKIKKDDKVLLYSNGLGIIARGIADGQIKVKEDKGECDAEYFTSLTEFYEYIQPISYKKIREIVKKAEPSFGRPFNVTLIKFSFPASKEIWDDINKYI